MDRNQEILELIKTTARNYIADAGIMLFGSRARKDNASDSDFDILIITRLNLTAAEKLPLKTSIRKELLNSGIRTDILIQSIKELAVKKKLPGHIIRTILNEAVLL